MSFSPKVEIGGLVEKVQTWDPRKSQCKDVFSYIDLSSVDKERKVLDPELILSIEPKEAPSRARQLVEFGDVLVATVRPNLNGVAVVDDKVYSGATASTGYCVLRPKKNRLDTRYLYYWVRTENFVKEMVRLSTGANYPAVSDRIIKDSKIPLPPLKEQKRIAAILDKADAIRRKRQQAIDLTDQLLRSVFLDMFGDPVTNPKGWDTEEISSLCKIVRGSSPRPKGDSRYYGGDVPRLMVADLTRDGWSVTPKIDTLTTEGAKKSRPVKAGTLVMAVSGNVGLVSVLKIDACIHDGFVGFIDLKEDVVLTKYLLLCLHFLKITHEGRKAGAIFQNLTTHDIRAMEIPIPPMKKQRELITFLENHLDLLKKISDKPRVYEDLFNSLTQNAFSGKLSKQTEAA